MALLSDLPTCGLERAAQLMRCHVSTAGEIARAGKIGGKQGGPRLDVRRGRSASSTSGRGDVALQARGVWWLYVTHHGERFRRSTGVRDKRDAQRIHDELKARLWKQQRGGTLHSALAKWAQDKGEPDQYRVGKLIREIRDVPLAGIDLEALAKAIPGRSAGTYNRYVNVLHAAGVKGLKPRKSPPGRIRWLTAEEWVALRAAMPGAWRPMADFGIATGLRQANVFWLEWAQVDSARRKAWIHPDEAKSRAPIGIPLSEAAMAVLEQQRGKSEVWVFPMADGNPLPKLKSRDWKAAVTRAGIAACTWHDLRHTWATWHIMGGTPLEVLQRLGGWKDLRMVLKYAHLADSFVDRYAENAQPYSNVQEARERETRAS
jgi:integrase